MADLIRSLEEKVERLEKLLANEKAKNASCKPREKIQEMSAEVVDSNPYRYEGRLGSY